MALAREGSSFETVKKNLINSVGSVPGERSNLGTMHNSELIDPERPSPVNLMYKNTIGSSKLKQPRHRLYDKPGGRCGAGKCPCCCHSRSSLRRRLISLTFRNVSPFRTPCNYHACDGPQVTMSAEFQIWYWALKLAVLTSLDVSWTLGTLSISPVLRVNRLVDDVVYIK